MFKKKLMNIPQKQTKHTFVGISFSSIPSNESAVAVLDNNLNILTLEKLFSYSDTEFFLKNFSGYNSAAVAVSTAKNEIMISNKWKYASRIYHPVNLNSKIMNRDGWADRFSKKGTELFKNLKASGVDIYRFETSNSKKALGCNEAFTDRSPADCKALQNALRCKLNMSELPSNMLPVSQLEAVLGAYTLFSYFNDDGKCKKLYEYFDIPVIGFDYGRL